jgi:hypothetical protein
MLGAVMDEPDKYDPAACVLSIRRARIVRRAVDRLQGPDVCRALPGYVPVMTNPFGAVLHRDSIRWAAAKCVSETVIAAVLLLLERSVDEIVPNRRA